MVTIPLKITKNTHRYSLIINTISIALCLLYGGSIHSQDCTAKLKGAERDYDNGIISHIPKTLSGCLLSGLSKEEKRKAYKLIINSFIYNEDLRAADSTMLLFLKDYPEYSPQKPADKAEFIHLYNKFETLPTFSLGFYAGTNLSEPSTIQEHAISNTTNKKYNNAGPGLQLGARFSKTVHPAIDINFSPGIAITRYQYKDTTLSFSQLTLTERQTSFSLPLSVSYIYQLKKWKPYIDIGINIWYLMSATGTPKREYTDNSHDNVTGTDINLTDNRNKLNASFIGNIGVQYKISHGYFFLSAGYQLGLFNQVNAQSRYDNADLNYLYFYVDDDFKLNQYTLSVGYMYMIYKPKRKTFK